MTQARGCCLEGFEEDQMGEKSTDVFFPFGGIGEYALQSNPKHYRKQLRETGICDDHDIVYKIGFLLGSSMVYIRVLSPVKRTFLSRVTQVLESHTRWFILGKLDMRLLSLLLLVGF